MKKQSRKSPSHIFKFKIEMDDGEMKEMNSKAIVTAARKAVTVILTKDHVRTSIMNNGVGNTAKCAMAVCCRNQPKGTFSHPFVGFIDWQYSTAFLATHLNKQGMPSKCIRYYHDDNIAKLNDTPGGQKKLLKRLEDEGDIIIRLRPRIRNDHTLKGGTGRKDGSRSHKGTIISKGARARYAFAQAGAAPQEFEK